MRDDDPSSERLRLEEVHRTGVLSRPIDDAVRDCLEMARKAFDARTVALNIITETEQIEKYVVGEPLGNLDRGLSFCQKVTSTGAPLHIDDTHALADYARHPLVTDGPRLRSYHGCPVLGLRDLAIGALCVLDPNPKAFDDKARALLSFLARTIARLIVPEAAYTKESHLPRGFLSGEQIRDSAHATLQASRRIKGLTGAVLYVRLDTEVRTKTAMTPRDLREVEVATEQRLAYFSGKLSNAEVGVTGPWRYAIVCDDFPDTDTLSAAAGTLVATLNDPIHLGEGTIFPNCTVAYFLDDTESIDPSMAIDYCNTVVSRRRVEPQDTIAVTSDEIDYAIRFSSAHGKIHEALREKRVFCVYQPLIKIGSGALYGFEALMRWIDPDLGEFGAEAILEICEAQKLQATLDYVIFETACDAATKRQKSIDDGARIAINIDTKTLQAPDFDRRIKKLIAKSGVAPESIVIEITEHSLFENIEGARRNMEALNALGVVFALDDFGTGYSSISNLRLLPFGKIKIDRSFVSTMEDEEASRTLVRAMTSTAKALGMVTTGEGVETEAQSLMLAATGCDFAQGYYFSKPMSEEDFLGYRGAGDGNSATVL